MVTASLAMAQTSTAFSGAKVNGGTVTHTMKDGKHVLTLSGDFQVPDTPDPHWQVVDSKGTCLFAPAPASEEPGRPREGSHQHVHYPAGIHQGRSESADLLRMGGSVARRSIVQQSRDDRMSVRDDPRRTGRMSRAPRQGLEPD